MPVPHKGSQISQHRVLSSERYTDATQSAGWAQTAVQRETGGFTILGCGQAEGFRVIGRENLPIGGPPFRLFTANGPWQGLSL